MKAHVFLVFNKLTESLKTRIILDSGSIRYSGHYGLESEGRHSCFAYYPNGISRFRSYSSAKKAADRYDKRSGNYSKCVAIIDI